MLIIYYVKKAEPFLDVQKEVADILKDKIVVGHALQHDFGALLLDHPYKLVRDTSHYKPFRKITNGRTPSLKKLTKVILGLDVQGGEHSSVNFFLKYNNLIFQNEFILIYNVNIFIFILYIL